MSMRQTPPMLHRLLSICTVLLLTTLGSHQLHAEFLPDWDVEDSVFRAELVIEATLLEGNTVQVEKVLMGPASVGQTLQIESFVDLSPKLFHSTEEALSALFLHANGKETKTPPDVAGRLVLFLSKNEDQQWETEGWGAGVKWLVDGKVYGYQQVFTNSEPYSLVPDRQVKTEDELRCVVQAAITKKVKFITARSLVDPAKRIEALSHYLHPEEKNASYFSAAIEALAKEGPLAGPLLRRVARESHDTFRRDELLKALGVSRDPEAVPFLLTMAERASPLVKAIEPFRWETLSAAERDAVRDWSIAIYVLADMADKRAVPAFRDAMLWAVNRNRELFESAARGLRNLPDSENIPFLAQAFTSIPAGEGYDATVYHCLLALREHRYPTAVPVLAGQLNFPVHPKSGHDPQVYNARIVHAALVEIVGSDLGTSKEAWLKWFEKEGK
jgi:hypothetical protein